MKLCNSGESATCKGIDEAINGLMSSRISVRPNSFENSCEFGHTLKFDLDDLHHLTAKTHAVLIQIKYLSNAPKVNFDVENKTKSFSANNLKLTC